MNLKLLKILEENGNLKPTTFLNENKDYIVSLILKGFSYKEIVIFLNEKAKEAGLNSVNVKLNSFVSWLNRNNLTKNAIMEDLKK